MNCGGFYYLCEEMLDMNVFYNCTATVNMISTGLDEVVFESSVVENDVPLK